MRDLSLAIFGLGILVFVAFLCWLTHSLEPCWCLLLLIFVVIGL